jgi:hypothetical protein
MHGTWIGYSDAEPGKRRFLAEHHRQDLDSFAICGVSCAGQKQDWGTWRSNSVQLDVQAGALLFTYAFEKPAEPNLVAGIHSSVLQFESNGPPSALFGFAHDLNSKRMGVHYEKLSSTLEPFCFALEAAERRFGREPCSVAGPENFWRRFARSWRSWSCAPSRPEMPVADVREVPAARSSGVIA